MLQIGDRPAWRTVTGGSTQYVARLTAGFRDRIRLLTPVVSVRRDPTGVSVRDGSGRTEVYDHVVFATHADTTLRILGDDATVHRAVDPGRVRIQANTAVLHRDPSLMPRRRAVWASWNYLGDVARNPVGLTYWMNRLQNLRTRRPVFVTLNPTARAARDLHPLLVLPPAGGPRGRRRAGEGAGASGRPALLVRRRMDRIRVPRGRPPLGPRGRRRPGRARPVGLALPAGTHPCTRMTHSAIYVGTVAHRRFFPVRHRFRYGVYYLWLDLSELAALDRTVRGFGYNRAAPFAFHDRDHGPHDGSALRPWFEGYLRAQGIDLEGGPVRILTIPRVFGYAFNPISVWCGYGPGDDLRAVLYEVTNTFGQHHAYLGGVEGADVAP